jgi:hypothetical protein
MVDLGHSRFYVPHRCDLRRSHWHHQQEQKAGYPFLPENLHRWDGAFPCNEIDNKQNVIADGGLFYLRMAKYKFYWVKVVSTDGRVDSDKVAFHPHKL